MASEHCASAHELAALVEDAGQRTFDVVRDLSDTELEVPPLPTVNPLRWEIGHISFFYDAMVLRELGRPSLVMPSAETLYDSFDVAHVERWGLVLPTRGATMDYRSRVHEVLIDRLGRGERTPRETYLYHLGALHEDMHGEALAYTRQTLSYAAPLSRLDEPPPIEDEADGDAPIPGGTFRFGAEPDEPFVFDNEKWAHEVVVEPFVISRRCVDNASFMAFVEDGGYLDPRLWSRAGWLWRRRLGRRKPRYWERSVDGWMVRQFDKLSPLAPHHPVCHVSWYEADAFSRWAGRRLPTELEWEVAALGQADASGALSPEKRRFPWGASQPTPVHANLDAQRSSTVDVRAHAAGDSAFGCRQMVGNVWEWTNDAFYPFPGYVVDTPYREYSAPWFGYQKVLRGAGWATRTRLARPGYRNFFTPDRDDVVAGFRTCGTNSTGGADPEWFKTARVL